MTPNATTLTAIAQELMLTDEADIAALEMDLMEPDAIPAEIIGWWLNEEDNDER